MSGTTDDGMRDDYTELLFEQEPQRGRFLERAMRARRLVEIDEDLLDAFPDARELNAALRSLVEASKHVKRAA